MTRSSGSRFSNVPRAHERSGGLSSFDGTFSGATIKLIAGESGAAGAVLFQDTDLLAYLASNDAAASSEIIGIATLGFAQGRPVNIQFSGPLTVKSWDWTVGARVYVGTDGGLTQTEPGTGYVLVVGVAISPNTIVINVERNEAGVSDATEVPYDNASSGLAAEDVQSAIDEVDANLDSLSASLGTAANADVSDFATAAQGSAADSAVQPDDLAAVATSGDYNDLTGKPSIDIAIISPDTSTSHVATESDNDGLLIFDSASDCTITLPETATEALDAGYHLQAINKGGGNLQIALEGTDTLEGVSLWSNPAQVVTIIKEVAGSPNAYRLIGNNWLPSAVEDDALTAPPSTPAVGSVYIVAAAATGDWTGQEDMFAIHVGADVYEFAPPAGVVYEKTSAVFIGWTGASWAVV